MSEARLVVGLQPVREAIRVHGPALERLWVSQRGGPRVQKLARFASDQGVVVEAVAPAHIDKLTRGAQHQGVAALAPPLAVLDAEDLEAEPSTLLVVLDGVTDPHNFGAVVRAVVALGGTGIVFGEHHAAPLTPATFRASAGAVEHARLYRAASLRRTLATFATRGITTVALEAEAEVELSAVDLGRPVALVVGAEDKGVSRSVRRECASSARLPMAGPIASLNASVACALALYEAVRQRARKPREQL